GSLIEQSASFPGSPPPLIALLRWISFRALRAASRASAANNLFQNFFGNFGIAFEILIHLFIDNNLYGALYFRVTQLGFSLPLELRFRHLDAQYRRHAFPEIISGYLDITFNKFVIFGVFFQ